MRSSPPNRNSQKLSAFRRGNATSLAPICSGTNQLKKDALNGITTRKTIVVPCIVKSWLKVSGSISVLSAVASCVRIRSASMPPTRNHRKAVIPYSVPMRL